MAIPAATMTLAAIIRPVEKGWLGAGLCGVLRLWTEGEAERAQQPGPASRLASLASVQWTQGRGRRQVLAWHSSMEARELGMDLPLASGAGIEAAALLLTRWCGRLSFDLGYKYVEKVFE